MRELFTRRAHLVLIATSYALAATIVLGSVLCAAPPTQPPSDNKGAWTLDQARAHLRLYPHDAYVEYVALQLARREHKVAEIAREIAAARQLDNVMTRRRGDVDLFSISSGALAIQESLQLDAMISDQPGIAPGGAVGAETPQAESPAQNAGRQGPKPIEEPKVAIKELVGPTIKSHPWDKMLAGRKPEISQLARSVPVDYYFAEFRSVNKLTEASKIADLWGTHLFNQAVQESQTKLLDERLHEQLAVEVNPLLAPFYDAIVERIGITGSDLFIREGSDVTLLFQVKQPAIFRAQMDKFLTDAAARPDAKRTSGTYQGVQFEAVETPDRRVHVYSAYPMAELHVRSNSRGALEHVIDAIKGHAADGKKVARLGDTSEFAYIRTLLPTNAKDEDGLIYFSDPFIRRMVGPQIRFAERRRMVCYNNLKMISHAALMYRTERGASAKSLDDLVKANCTPGEFGKENFACPDGGTYSLAEDGLTGVCSVHGYASSLTPCSEIEIRNVTAGEANAYRDFVRQYSEYWRLYFDPIAVRLTIAPAHYRAETIILPLIDNTVYTGLAAALGGKPEQLDALPVPNRNIFTVAARVDKRSILHQLRLDEFIEEAEPNPNAQKEELAEEEARAVQSLRELAMAALNYHDTHKQFPAAAKTDAQGRPLLSWRIELLPFIEENALYDQFHRDEPWDSDHNKQLIAKMPELFRPQNAKLAAAGKTKFVAAIGPGTVFPPEHKPLNLAQVTDGTSRTIEFVEAADDRAVIWTKPDDLQFKAAKPADGLESRSAEGYLVAMCDGSVLKLDAKIDKAILAAMFTRAGNETADFQKFVRPLSNNFDRRGAFTDVTTDIARDLNLGQVISKGIGNQLSLNIYDTQQLFDLSLPQIIAQSIGSFRGMGRRVFDQEMFWIPALASLNSPVYLALPIRDQKLVDDFLTRLDKYLAGISTIRGGGFFELQREFYQIPSTGGAPIRAATISLGPLKVRFFWQRIGDAFYVASQRDILTDLAALQSKGGNPPAVDTPAHALVRLRPEHWNHVLDHYRLGWEENNRQACLKNLGPLSSLARAVAVGRGDDTKPLTIEQLNPYTARLYDVRYFCPDDGHYTIGSDGAVTCSKHGAILAPRQSTAPAPNSQLGKLLNEYSDMSISLTFLDDGLHAVVDLKRKPVR